MRVPLGWRGTSNQEPISTRDLPASDRTCSLLSTRTGYRKSGNPSTTEAGSGAKWTYIPYKGGSGAIQDTVGGQTQVLMNGMLATLPQVQAGKLKVLGVSKATRVPLLPNARWPMLVSVS